MTILEALQTGPLRADGAMGTQLQAAGLEPGACGELWNLERADQVESIHRRYRDAGAQLITTNTFGANRILLAQHEVQDKVADINAAAVALARRAAGPDGWVLGDIGPFGGLLAPLGDHDPDAIYAAFVEQAAALHRAGADAIIIETMTAIEEAVLAIRAARSAGAPVVIASMAFDRTRVGARTMMGETPEQAAGAMLDAGAAIIGANCGSSLAISDYVDILTRMRAVAPGVPLLAQPNAGQPRWLDDRIVYPASPAQFAEGLCDLLNAGARIVGGCCGTTPEHIAAAGAFHAPF